MVIGISFARVILFRHTPQIRKGPQCRLQIASSGDNISATGKPRISDCRKSNLWNYGLFRSGQGWRGSCEEGFIMNTLFISKICTRASKPSTSGSVLLYGLASLFLVAGAIPSCATTAGFGRDVEKVGDEIQDAAN